MNKRTLGRVHRWIFIFMGVFMLVWLVSGVVMALPYYWFTGPSGDSGPVLDYNTVTLSPADAIAQLEQHTGTEHQLGVGVR